jgi:hypothetical protein
MSVEKFHLVNKAQRGFDAIADALLDDVYEDDLLVDEEGNVYMLVEEVEKSEKSRRYAANTAMGVGGAAGLAGAGIAGAGYRNVRLADKAKTPIEGMARVLTGAQAMHLGGLTAAGGAGVGAAGLALRARNRKKGRIEKADDSHRNAKLGAAGGAIGAAGLTALQSKKIARGYAVARALGVPAKDMNRAMAGGLGRRFGAATGGGALGGAAVDYARNKNKVEKGLPSVIRAGGGGSYGAFLRRANEYGKNASRFQQAVPGVSEGGSMKARARQIAAKQAKYDIKSRPPL